jgi:hypothetical protein
LHELDEQRAQCERQVVEAGFPLPLAHRRAWVAACRPAQSWFVHVQSSGGACHGGFAIDVGRSRAIPGHLILRAERFGSSLSPASLASAGVVLREIARQHARVLRLHVETFARDAATRDALEDALLNAGWTRVAATRRYRQTLAVDLAGDEPAIFASFHPTARRHVRAAEKHPVQVKPITEPALIPRMVELSRETMLRTGGAERKQNWSGHIALATEHPELARLVGLFRTDTASNDSLLAYAFACFNGDYAHYDTAASTRQTDLKIPLNYAIAWDLICWAKRNGATWFDFGGITDGHHGDVGDRLGGISDFKRYFSRNVIEVGGEWVFEPRRGRARIARAVSAGIALASSVRSRFGKAQPVVQRG